MADSTVSTHSVLTQVTFRKNVFEVKDAQEFRNGVVCGQTMAVGDEELVQEACLFRIFEESVQDLEMSESWLVGFFLGLADALLRGRKTIPIDMPGTRMRCRK